MKEVGIIAHFNQYQNAIAVAAVINAEVASAISREGVMKLAIIILH